jgi:hypothetical protein
MVVMGTRFCVIFAMMTLLSGCIVTPRFEMTERFQFNYAPMAAQVPMSPEDLLCCSLCRA